MPIHDWSRVNANLFHDFHQTWTVNLANSLNSGLLPMRYSALVERHGAGLASDVQKVLAQRGNRVAIHHPLGRVICVIEATRAAGRPCARSSRRPSISSDTAFIS